MKFIQPLRVYNSVVFSVFPELGNHHQLSNSPTFSSPQIVTSYSSPLIPWELLSVFMDLPLQSISCNGTRHHVACPI